MRTTAAIAPAKGQPFVVEPIEIEEPRADEVLVRIVAAGMCHTDLGFRDMFPWDRPIVLGHEGAGIVERVGANVTALVPGDRVVLTFDSCGRCRRCARGKPSYCDQFRPRNFGGARADRSSALKRDGGPLAGHFFGQSSFSGHAIATERNAIKVADDLPLERLGPLGCGIITGAGAVLNSLGVPTGASIAVFGAGAVGISGVMAARVAGATTIIAVDVKPARLALAMELGATHIVNAAQEDVVKRIRALTLGGADFSIDTTGVPDVLRQAVVALATLGVCGVIAGSEAPMTLPWRDVLYGRTVRGILEGDAIPSEFIPLLIELHRQGRFPFDRLVRYYPLAEINQAAQDSLNGETVKPILTF
ncbi:MAG: NAD(P)-dependent alcohol dehydrogenase [Candidatus Rokubacteria bacterium]|nr:NAD(P)-dependent alcohol dehydrogenase [Candidatus Rokubacteria bacterium]